MNSDWFIALFAPVVIGRSNYFGIGFSTVIRKSLFKNIFKQHFPSASNQPVTLSFRDDYGCTQLNKSVFNWVQWGQLEDASYRSMNPEGI